MNKTLSTLTFALIAATAANQAFAAGVTADANAWWTNAPLYQVSAQAAATATDMPQMASTPAANISSASPSATEQARPWWGNAPLTAALFEHPQAQSATVQMSMATEK